MCECTYMCRQIHVCTCMCVCTCLHDTVCMCVCVCMCVRYALYCSMHFIAAKEYGKCAIFILCWGSKEFQLEGIISGWQSIIDLYQRKCRRNSGAARMVPKLREVHVLRDSWTKLNVHPAKIMQVMYSVVLCQYMVCII